MRPTAPKWSTMLLSLLLASVVFATKLGWLNIKGLAPIILDFEFYLLTAAYVILLAGNLLRRF